MDRKTEQQDKREVQLEGERLERMRRHVSQAHDHLMSIADIVLPAIGSERVAEEITEIKISINAENTASGPREIVAMIFDEFGQCAGTYRDPPGVCTTEC
jgi:hypothetical protein